MLTSLLLRIIASSCILASTSLASSAELHFTSNYPAVQEKEVCDPSNTTACPAVNPPIIAPNGSIFTSVPVGSKGERIAAFWTEHPKNLTATHAFIMVHGKFRNGDVYWTTMNNILNLAVSEHVPGAHSNSIIVAPEFFSRRLNKTQYHSHELAWGDRNTWEAGMVATHPKNTTLDSFDALDALVDEFSNSTRYPSLTNITVVGHGGGGQLIQRYAMTAKDAPANRHIRYIHGDASSCAYFTENRPASMISHYDLPSKKSCPGYNTWRYGFDDFNGTAQGRLTPQQYFQQYVSRDVVSIVGLKDASAGSGDTSCEAHMQGGTARRDRNLSWWQYVNLLAGTNEDILGFPAYFKVGAIPDWSHLTCNSISLRLIVIADARHSVQEVFGGPEGQAALFSSEVMPTGWRPVHWVPVLPHSIPNCEVPKIVQKRV